MDSSLNRSADADRQRECRLLNERGLSAEQIAEKLGLPIGDVKRYLRPDVVVVNIARDHDLPKRRGYKASYKSSKSILSKAAELEGFVSRDNGAEYSLFGRKNKVKFSKISNFEIITPIDYSSAINLSFRKKLELIEQSYRPLGGNKPIGEALLTLFPGLAEELKNETLDAGEPPAEINLALPAKAPALWGQLEGGGISGRRKGETAPDFTKRVYGAWIGKGLARSDIKRLDQKLYQALATWMHRNGPLDFDLPTRSDVSDQWVDRVTKGVEPVSDLGQINRLRSALRRQEAGRKSGK